MEVSLSHHARSYETPSVEQTGSGPRVTTQTGKGANEKISFYLRPDQVEKLDELALAYRKRAGTRLNRNELVRRLIDRGLEK